MEIGGRFPNNNANAAAAQHHLENQGGKSQSADLAARKQEFAQLLQVDTQIAQRAMRNTSEQVRAQSVMKASLPKRRKGGGGSQAAAQDDEEDLQAAQETAMGHGTLTDDDVYKMQFAVFSNFLSMRQSQDKDADEDNES